MEHLQCRFVSEPLGSRHGILEIMPALLVEPGRRDHRQLDPEHLHVEYLARPGPAVDQQAAVRVMNGKAGLRGQVGNRAEVNPEADKPRRVPAGIHRSLPELIAGMQKR